MNARTLSRLLYRLLLQLHPAAFRQRFGKEMLCIFDLASSRGQMTYLLFDGVRSVTVQYAKLEMQKDVAAPFGLEIKSSSLTVARLGQAALLSTVVLFVIASLIAREMPSVWYLDHDQQPSCQQTDEPKTKVVPEIR